jgi:hypothetical protein
MANAVEKTRSGLTVARALLGKRGHGRGSVAQQVHDGDTITVEALGNLGVRMLGIDTPEVSFTLPESDQFTSIGNAAWQTFLDDPLAGASGALLQALGGPLVTHLRAATGQGSALNHAFHAQRAHRELEGLVSADMAELGQGKDSFAFFLAFAHEIMDGYGRFLCFINRDQPVDGIPTPRPRSYNERLLEMGVASPYFIWPNVNPFLRSSTLRAAVPTPGDIAATATSASGLGSARTWVRAARQSQKGIFEAGNTLKLQPFELRFLARQQAPDRWLIDLSDVTTNTLLKPENYCQVPNIEDRLFVPSEYVPLFIEQGWQRQN